MKWQIIKNKSLVILLLGQFISLIGTLIQEVALSLYVLKITGSGTLFASVLAVALIPQLILGPICGVFSDWFDRKKVVIYLDMLSGIIVGTIFFISLNNGLSLLSIYICVILLSVISSLYDPTIEAIIPSIVSKNELMEATAAESLILTIGEVIAPIIGGIVYEFYGINLVFLINCISFISASICEVFIIIPCHDKTAEGNKYFPQFRSDFAQGIKFILEHKLVLKMMICCFIVNIVLNPYFSIGVIYISKTIFNVADVQYGIIDAILVVGTLIGPLISSKISKKFGMITLYERVIFFSGLLIAAVIVTIIPLFMQAFGRNSSLIIFVIISFIAALIVTVLSIIMHTVIRKQTPNEIKGRVSSILTTISIGAIPLGEMLFGALFDVVPVYYPIVLTSVVMVLTAVVFKFSSKSSKDIVTVEGM